jgi:uncharacterized protein YcfJ
MRAVGTLIVMTSLVGVASTAGASPPPSSGYGGDYDYAPVTRVEPIVRQVRIETPRRECWDETQSVETRPHISDPRVGGRTLLGSVIGGVVGHQFGSGSGRDAATIAGALIGAGVGYNSAARATGYSTEERTVQRCATRSHTDYEERIEGYRVTYEYNGRQYTTRMPYDPGERIRVHVAVSPAG